MWWFFFFCDSLIFEFVSYVYLYNFISYKFTQSKYYIIYYSILRSEKDFILVRANVMSKTLLTQMIKTQFNQPNPIAVAHSFPVPR